jgi:hypothetical protein
MKPVCQFVSPRAGTEFKAVARQFPQTDYFFQSRMDDWRGFSPHERRDPFRNFRRLSREYYGAAAREHLKEMIVFGLVAVTSAWPLIYTAFVIVRLLSKEHP